jgi:Matrixin
VVIRGSYSAEEATVFGTGDPEPCDNTSYNGCLDPCTDTNNHVNLPKRRVKTKQPYYFKPPATYPAGLTQATALPAIKAGTQSIVKVNNDCGQADFIERTAPYKGTTTVGTGINGSTNSCATDAKNVVDIGKLAGLAGLACTWHNTTPPRYITEADIRLSKDTPWTVTPDAEGCFNLITLQGVMTHERGHAFGLAHTDGAPPDYTHAPQTMYPATFPCSSYNHTLGAGDMAALNVLY